MRERRTWGKWGRRERRKMRRGKTKLLGKRSMKKKKNKIKISRKERRGFSDRRNRL